MFMVRKFNLMIRNGFRKEFQMTQGIKIMGAVDLSDYSAMTVRYSLELAKQMDADLRLINVIYQENLEKENRRC